jgi:hypothetical protein
VIAILVFNGDLRTERSMKSFMIFASAGVFTGTYGMLSAGRIRMKFQFIERSKTPIGFYFWILVGISFGTAVAALPYIPRP